MRSRLTYPTYSLTFNELQAIQDLEKSAKLYAEQGETAERQEVLELLKELDGKH